MATRITYHQIYLSAFREEADGEGSSVVIPHAENGWCQIFDVDFVGGGSDKRFLMHMVVCEPVPDEPSEPEQSVE